jgi:hypothetical protein
MRIVIEVPDLVAQDAVREYRTVRQQVEYLLARALREADHRDQPEPTRQPAEPDHRPVEVAS